LIKKNISEKIDSNVQNDGKNLPELPQSEVIDHDETIQDTKRTTQDLNLKLENVLINLDNALTDKRYLKEKINNLMLKQESYL
jgi:hypothetical protein